LRGKRLAFLPHININGGRCGHLVGIPPHDILRPLNANAEEAGLA
jgi:hypothetical protein